MKKHEPYFAVIFTSTKSPDLKGYAEASSKLEHLVHGMEGFLGMDSLSSANHSITISYWSSIDAIKKWKHQQDHQVAQQQGKAQWYSQYSIRIARIESEYHFGRDDH